MQPEIRNNYLQSLSSPLTLLKAQNAITATAKLRWHYKSSATGQNQKNSNNVHLLITLELLSVMF